MIKKIIFIFIFLSQFIYSLSNYKNFEDSYIEIKCGELKDSFFMIKYDIENEKVYIGLNSLFYFLEIYNLEIDLKNRQVKGNFDDKNIDIKFNDNDSFIMDNSIYIDINSLKEKLNFKVADFDFSLLTLTLVPNFSLPYEIREKSKIERLRLDEEKLEEEIDVNMTSKIFSPGFLKINWSKSDLKNSNYNFEYEYGTQFLYGDLYLSGELYPKNKIVYGNLTYSNFFKNNDLILGNFSMITPHFINLDSEIIGISLKEEDTYMTRDGGITTIKGEAENAQVIELYREFTLIDYIYPKSKYFEFKIFDGILNSDYILKIYYNDGRIEEKKVFSLTDMDILEKGKNRTSIQVGKNSNNGNPQGISHIYYGLTDNLTVGLGAMNLISSNEKKYRFLENDIIFNTQHKTFPTLITYRNFFETKEKENSYNLIIDQKLKSYSLKFLQEKYSPFVFNENKIKEYTSISLGKSFNKNSFEIGFNDKKYFEDLKDYESKNIYLSWYTSIFSPLSFSIKMEKDIYRNNNYSVFYPSISYSGIFSIILDGEIGKEREDKYYTQNYNLRLTKRDIEIIKNKLFLDIGIYARYSNINEKFRYGITFNLKLDDYVHLDFTSSTNINEDRNRNTINSIKMTKLLNLNSPLDKADNNSSVSNSWITGKVYLDKNGNHIFDNNDIPLPNVEILVDNRSFIIDKNGKYVANGISGNKISTVTVNRKTIDPTYKNTDGPLKIKSKNSSILHLDIPIQPISIISGNIILTEDFTEKQFIQNLSLINILLEKDNEVVAETDPEFDGMYFFEDVLPGKYTIKFNYLGYENIDFSSNSIEIEVKNSDEGDYFEGLDTEMIKKEKEEDKN
ncbi:hypothetical protein HF862_06385 [Fusobacterium sp. FSA-380-WT-3A]|nr:hypothetical protein [Fusobacterium sp. FSA-380-WT-3A]